MTRIHILPGNATYNRGDRLNLTAQIRLLRSTMGDCIITVSTFLPERDQQWYDASCIQRGRFFLSRAERKTIREADISVWGGGALAADNASWTTVPYWLLIIAYIRLWMHKPVMAWAHGIVLQTFIGRIIGSLLFRLPTAITVRDRDCIDTFRNLPLPICHAHLAADTALLTELYGPVEKDILGAMGIHTNNRPLCIIAPTFWPFYHRSGDLLPYVFAVRMGMQRKHRAKQVDDCIARLAELADRLMSDGYHVLLIPHYPDPLWNDTRHLEELRARCTQTSSISLLSGDTYSPHQLRMLWASADLAITHSYHDTILSTVNRVPCVQLYYESKGKILFEDLDIADCQLPWTILFEEKGVEKIMQTVHHVRKVQPEIRKMLDRNLPILQKRSLVSAHILAAILTIQLPPPSQKSPPRSPSA